MKKSTGGRRVQAPAANIRLPKPMSMLRDDHNRVTDLFEKFERANDERTQWELARKAIHELKIHAEIEEELFYPSVRRIIGDEDLINEAAEEHHVVQVLIGEIEDPDLESTAFHAKFMVLAETVRHHIKQEEGQMFTKLALHNTDLDELGAWMEERRQELERELPRESKERPAKYRVASNSSKVTALNRPREVR